MYYTKYKHIDYKNGIQYPATNGLKQEYIHK